jgi:hypothetical protein
LRRFFSDDSYWNTPLGPRVEADPRSARLIALMAGSTNGFWMNLDYWTIPVYEVDARTPRHQVGRLLSPQQPPIGGWIGSTDPAAQHHPLGHAAGFNPVPIPPHAVPSREEDAHMAIVDWNTMTAWDMLSATRRPDGQWLAATGIRYRLDGTGVFGLDQFPVRDGESIHYFGPGRASGVPIIAGLIMLDEILQGRIRHRLAFCSPYSALRRFIHPPVVWTDGPCADGLPEGAVVQLDPGLDLDRLALSPGAKVVARALQEFGAVNTDTGGGNALYGEGLWAAPGRTWSGVLADHGLMSIPMSSYRVLRMDSAIERGMNHRVAGAAGG